MKKTLLVVTLLAALSAGAAVSAAPMTNTQAGDLKVNLNYGFGQKEGDRNAKSRFSGGDITYGIGHRTSLQYSTNMTRGDSSQKIDEHYFTGIYDLSSYVSVYGGLSYIKTDINGGNKHATGYQVGLKGQVPLADRVMGFATVGAGDDTRTYSVGVGYAFNKNWDSHIMYRKSTVKTDNYDDDVKGWQIGMGYKF